jgi:carbon storage regulator
MLILTRRIGETLHIGDGIKVTVTAIKGNQVRIGIDAAPDVKVMRDELMPPDRQVGVLPRTA